MWSLCQSLENASPMRVHVYYYLVQLAGKLNQIDLVYKDMESLRSTFVANPPSNEQMQKLFRLLHEVLLSNGRSEDASQVETPFECCKSLWLVYQNYYIGADRKYLVRHPFVYSTRHLMYIKANTPPTICFIGKWPQTKCKVTFDTSFWPNLVVVELSVI